MEPNGYFEQLRKGLEGHTISMTRLAANSLLIYVECEPGDKQGVTIWFEPTWHFAGPEGVLVGSRQAQMDDDPDDDEAFYRVAEALRMLEGKSIQSVVIEPITHDLHVRIDDGYWVKIFASDPNEPMGPIARNRSETGIANRNHRLSRLIGIATSQYSVALNQTALVGAVPDASGFRNLVGNESLNVAPRSTSVGRSNVN